MTKQAWHRSRLRLRLILVSYFYDSRFLLYVSLYQYVKGLFGSFGRLRAAGNLLLAALYFRTSEIALTSQATFLFGLP